MKLSPDDYRALEAFLYGTGEAALGTAPADTRLDGRTVRAYRSGRTPVPATVAAYLVGRAALRLTLKGWSAETLNVSAEIRAEIQKRLDEALRHAAAAHHPRS